MDWTEIVVSVPAEHIETAENIATMTVPYGMYVEDYSSLEEEVQEIARIDLIDEELLAKDRSKALIHLYIDPSEHPAEAVSFIRERLSSEGIPCEISTGSCDVEACLESWKQYFAPLPVGERLLIRPVWREDYEPDGRLVLNLDPGLAFGSGTHETTRLCLQMLERFVTPGCSLLDVGCGSGILSVAGLLLGAKEALGIDIDEMAVKASVSNARLNGVENRYRGVKGNLAEEVQGCFDVITANIVADAIILLSADVEKLMGENSVYIMSGIIDSRLQDVLAALPETLEIIEQQEEKGWMCLAAKKKTERTS